MARRLTARISSPLMDCIDAAGYRRDWFALNVLAVPHYKLSKVERGVERAPDWWYPRAAAFLRVPLERVLPARPARAAA